MESPGRAGFFGDESRYMHKARPSSRTVAGCPVGDKFPAAFEDYRFRFNRFFGADQFATEITERVKRRGKGGGLSVG